MPADSSKSSKSCAGDAQKSEALYSLFWGFHKGFAASETSFRWMQFFFLNPNWKCIFLHSENDKERVINMPLFSLKRLSHFTSGMEGCVHRRLFVHFQAEKLTAMENIWQLILLKFNRVNVWTWLHWHDMQFVNVSLVTSHLKTNNCRLQSCDAKLDIFKTLSH